MNIIKIAVIGGVIALAWFMLFNKSFDPIPFSGDLYKAVTYDHSSKVMNIYYTPNGVDPKTSPKLLHISSARHADISESNWQGYRQHLIRSWSLKPVGKSKYKFKGKFGNKKIVYFLEKDKAFISYATTKASIESGVLSRIEQTNETLDAMDRISLAHLK